MTTTQVIEPAQFRSVLSAYPTGVCAITAVVDGEPTGFVVGTFTSVSLEPPLVGFFPDKKSTTFPKVRRAGAFCANVLSAADEPLCRTFSTQGADRFAEVSWYPGPTGSPILDGAAAWIDCTIDQICEIGDHLLVVGRVVDLAHGAAGADPLLFHRGRYRNCVPSARETRKS